MAAVHNERENRRCHRSQAADAAAKEAGHDKAIRLDANALRNGDADRGHQGNSRVVGHKLSDKTGDEEQDHHNDERRGRGSDQPQNVVRNDTA